MGVLPCSRTGCGNIMCKQLCNVNQNYICSECIDEFEIEMNRVGFESDKEYKQKIIYKKYKKFLESRVGKFILKKGPKKDKEIEYTSINDLWWSSC